MKLARQQVPGNRVLALAVWLVRVIRAWPYSLYP
jgi:hypothetical protein